ncbi:MAG: pyridine nucleotide-disulfide oxidoreductase [Microbacteriaceae bacterium]|nr:MAG: pyridine nucleotide-disulfide oxidoreductase [Microbacteriaceae bacterium]
MSRPLRVAIIGAGPAGIYAGNILSRTGLDVSIDVIESLPAPYGLIRYGVAPDHPRIKGVVRSLHEMLDAGTIRLLGNVTLGVDLILDDLRRYYDAVIFATGAARDAALTVPGIDLPGSYGAADFVSWYDGHPDVSRDWPLDAREIAVVGNGNVALDVARVLAKLPHDLQRTDMPANVYDRLATSAVTDVHVFGRRSPAHVKFTPLELRELGEVAGIDVIVDAEDFADVAGIDAVARAAGTNQVKVMTRILRGWLERERTGASRRLHLHFFHQPTEILGRERVEGIRFERTALDRSDGSDGTDGARGAGSAASAGAGIADAAGAVRGTGTFVDYPVQAVYRAVGYFGSPVPGVPFDERRGVIRNSEGRVLDDAGEQLAGLYATGWIKRGPVGLIGHTKGDAMETIEHLVSDFDALPRAEEPDEQAVLDLLAERGVEYTTWRGWLSLDEHERALGAADRSPVERERVKVVPRDEQVAIARAVELLAPLH